VAASVTGASSQCAETIRIELGLGIESDQRRSSPTHAGSSRSNGEPCARKMLGMRSFLPAFVSGMGTFSSWREHAPQSGIALAASASFNAVRRSTPEIYGRAPEGTIPRDGTQCSRENGLPLARVEVLAAAAVVDRALDAESIR